MSSICEPLATSLEAFDGRGVHCGSAVLTPSGFWRVTIANVDLLLRERATAEHCLRTFGAQVVRERVLGNIQKWEGNRHVDVEEVLVPF